MKKVFIMIFLSISTFFIASAFITKGFNKEPMTFNNVLVELEISDIGFDIKEDIEELTTSLRNLNNVSNYSNTTLDALKSIVDTIYYFGRFVIKMIVHTIVASLNVIILVLRCIGFTTMDYIHISTDNDDDVRIVPGVPFTDNPDYM